MTKTNLENLPIDASARDVQDYIERFEIWCLTQETLWEERKVAFFLNSIGKDAYSLLKNLVYPDTPISLPLDKLRKALLQHVQPVTFEAAERSKFHMLVRNSDQQFRGFILQLQTQAAKCNFGDQLDTQLRDRLIAGINDSNLQRQLLLLEKPTFQSVRTVCEQYQDVANAMSDYKSVDSLTDVLHMSSKFKQCKRRQFEPEGQFSKTNKSLGKCGSCGQHHSRYSCKFRNSKCYNCGRIGHIKQVCRQKVVQITAKTDDQLTVEDSFRNLSLSVSSDTAGHITQTLMNDSGHCLSFILDTGSIESLISEVNLRLFAPQAKLCNTHVCLKGITGHAVPVIGSTQLCISDDKGHHCICEFIVTKYGPSILGLKAMHKLEVSISLLTNTTIQHELKRLIAQCSSASGGMKVTPINLEFEGDPVFLKRRIIPYGMRDLVEKSIKDLCSRGILEKIDASHWATPIVTPLKADGHSVRICGDYRLTLNPKLLKQTCSTVEPEDILNTLTGSKVFSKIDLKDAYLQLPLSSESSLLTTINTPFGLFKYNFLPFGLSPSPAIFQRVIDSIIQGLNGVAVYQDDVIVHADSDDQHDDRLLKLFRKFAEVNIAINPKKCIFKVSKIQCLGYTIDANGYRPNPDKMNAIVKVQSPTNMHELRSLLGSVQYYSRFIPNFSQKAYCLFDLLSAKSFRWETKHETSLRHILNILQSETVLRTFSPNAKTTLITDASPFGLGAILEQNGFPIICISRRLSVAEKGYAQTQREALAVYWAVKRLHKYLFGIKFTIISDHEALKFIYNPSKSLSKSSAAMVQRWCIALSAYNYEIKHQRARTIQHVDHLSRMPTETSDPMNEDCLLIQPLPFSRENLIQNTRKYYSTIISAIHKGWSIDKKKKYPEFYRRREELSTTPDGVLCMQDRAVIPPNLRQLVLQDMHSGHLGIDKMKSLARMSCWWPNMDIDITRTAKECTRCLHKIHSQPSQWLPWPSSTEVWQRIHVDYCGPFLGKYYALVIIDSYSKWPEVFLTDSNSAEFSKKACSRLFSREGIPSVLVSDNGSHFAAAHFTDWLKTIGCRHLFTAPRHPCSNGLAENFVRTLKSAIQSLKPSTFAQLDQGIENFLLQYRNCRHSTTNEIPSKMFKGRILRSHLQCINSSDVTFFKGNDLRPSKGVVLQNIGKRMLKILDVEDLSEHRRHIDQVRFDIAEIPNQEYVHEDDIAIKDEPRRSERLKLKTRIDYRKLNENSSTGGCDICE